MQRIWEHAIVPGASSNAFDAWLLLRGLRTLALRVTRQSDSALLLARMLEAHPQWRRSIILGSSAIPSMPWRAAR